MPTETKLPNTHDRGAVMTPDRQPAPGITCRCGKPVTTEPYDGLCYPVGSKFSADCVDTEDCGYWQAGWTRNDAINRFCHAITDDAADRAYHRGDPRDDGPEFDSIERAEQRAADAQDNRDRMRDAAKDEQLTGGK